MAKEQMAKDEMFEQLNNLLNELGYDQAAGQEVMDKVAMLEERK